MAHKINGSFDNDDKGILIKQDSVTSIYNPTPMSPTHQNGNKLLSSLSTTDSPNHETNEQMKRNASYGNLENRTEARVLVMYTGGTIGMLRNEKSGEKSIFYSAKRFGHATRSLFVNIVMSPAQSIVTTC